MAIAHYIKEIGRGRDGARPLTRAQAADLMGLLLDGRCSDLEVGAFCLAMRIKGETPDEMAGFIDAARARLALLPAGPRPVVVLPSFNGARKLPVLTPLLALLLAREGLPVLLHGRATEDLRVTAPQVMAVLGTGTGGHAAIAPGEVRLLDTEALSAPLARLLDVRRTVGLRNPAHSLVKLLNPIHGPALVVASYTHGEYAQSMAATLALTGADALLLRGTEGEPVADARRQPQIDAFQGGALRALEAKDQAGLQPVAGWPAPDAAATAAYTQAVLDGTVAVPQPLARQVAHIVQTVRDMESATPRCAASPATATHA